MEARHRELLERLASSEAGLTEAEAERRRARDGENRIERLRRRPLPLRLLGQLTGLLALLLWAAAACAFVARLPELGWAVIAVVLINGAFSFVQEYRAERAVEALERLLPPEVLVVRDGAARRLPATEIVRGDVLRLQAGDQVPADGQLLEAVRVRVDQSALTGESAPVPKRADGPPSAPRPLERRDLLFAGSAVLAGQATLAVTATGMATEIGRVARLTQTVGEVASPLQRELRRVVRVVAALSVALGGGLLAVGVATQRVPLTTGLVFALGVIVANVPEGMLPTVTLSLALAVQRMAKRGTVVKRLSAVEALGAATVICTDKTGTLTENRMEVRAVFRPEGAGAGEEVLAAAVLAGTGERADPLEVALLAGAARAGVDPEALRRARPEIALHPFDPERRRMTVVRRDGRAAIAFAKGAAAEIVARSTALRRGGAIAPLDDALRRRVLDEESRLAAAGLRVIAVAERALTAPADIADEELERDLAFVGLVALWDPPRPEVPEAIATCARAGIRVIVVTGDHGGTARAIAGAIGLAVDRVVTGAELAAMGDNALGALLASRENVLFARAAPIDKLAVVRALRAAGEVVAATGDGVNDAPALRAADIGVAMGRRGTEVARQAAEMVITDDNFASIVEAVRQGRAVYDNLGKFIVYIFASNVPELVPYLAYVFLHLPLALTIMQILAIDLGTDLLPALALGAERPEPGIMSRPPRPRAARLLGAHRLLRAYGFLGAIEAALALAAFFAANLVDGWRPGAALAASGPVYLRATTMTLAAVVASQVGNAFACRTERASLFAVGVGRNRALVGAIAAEIALLLLLVYLPPLARLFGLAPPRATEWLLLLVCPPVVLGLEEARKAIARRALTRSDRRGPALRGARRAAPASP